MADNRYTHQDLVRLVDEAVDELGIDQAVRLFSSAFRQGRPQSRSLPKVRLIHAYLVEQAIALFEINAEGFYLNSMEEYREARMCCYHLLKKYSGCSYPMVAQLMHSTKRSVMYYTTETKDRLDIPAFYKGFVEKHRTLEALLLRFLATLPEKE